MKLFQSFAFVALQAPICGHSGQKIQYTAAFKGGSPFIQCRKSQGFRNFPIEALSIITFLRQKSGSENQWLSQSVYQSVWSCLAKYHILLGQVWLKAHQGSCPVLRPLWYQMCRGQNMGYFATKENAIAHTIPYSINHPFRNGLYHL